MSKQKQHWCLSGSPAEYNDSIGDCLELYYDDTKGVYRCEYLDVAVFDAMTNTFHQFAKNPGIKKMD